MNDKMMSSACSIKKYIDNNEWLFASKPELICNIDILLNWLKFVDLCHGCYMDKLFILTRLSFPSVRDPKSWLLYEVIT